MEFIPAIAICYLYLLGMWVTYEASIGDEEEEVTLDLLGAFFLLSWPISFPLITLWFLVFYNGDD